MKEANSTFTTSSSVSDVLIEVEIPVSGFWCRIEEETPPGALWLVLRNLKLNLFSYCCPYYSKFSYLFDLFECTYFPLCGQTGFIVLNCPVSLLRRAQVLSPSIASLLEKSLYHHLHCRIGCFLSLLLEFIYFLMDVPQSHSLNFPGITYKSGAYEIKLVMRNPCNSVDGFATIK